MSHPDDKEFAALIRYQFSTLRQTVNEASRAGLRITFEDRILDLLNSPDIKLNDWDIRIVRVL